MNFNSVVKLFIPGNYWYSSYILNLDSRHFKQMTVNKTKKPPSLSTMYVANGVCLRYTGVHL